MEVVQRKRAQVLIAGLPIEDADVLVLARLLREQQFEKTAHHVERAIHNASDFLPLTILERDEILWALDILWAGAQRPARGVARPTARSAAPRPRRPSQRRARVA